MATIQAKNVNHPDYQENLQVEKYEWVRNAILTVLPAYESGASVSFNDLEKGVRKHLANSGAPAELFPKPGSVRWYTKAVQLDLEARGLIERVPGVSPLRLRRLSG